LPPLSFSREDTLL